jgi:hypothetical protein
MLTQFNTISKTSLYVLRNSRQSFDIGKNKQQKSYDSIPQHKLNFIYAQALRAQALSFTSASVLLNPNRKLTKWINTIQASVREIKIFLRKNGDINYPGWYKDRKFKYPEWYRNLRDNLGIGYPGNESLDNMFCSAHRERISYLLDTLRTMNLATKYKPVIKWGIPVPIHNKNIAEILQPTYNSEEFKKIFTHCNEHEVFDLRFDEFGLPQTSVISPKEDYSMCLNKWITDTCRNIDIMKDKYPENCVPALKRLSEFYRSQNDIFDSIISEPALFNPGYGLGHVFNSKSLKTSTCYTKTRLESPGLYLSTVCDAITDGLIEGKKWGFKPEDIDDNTVFSIVNIVKYLKALNYPMRGSCGNWEEGTFNVSLTSDTEIINNGFRKLWNLLYNPEYDKKLSDTRKRIFEQLCPDNPNAFKADLVNLIKRGEERVRNQHFDEAPGERRADASLAFVTHTAKLDNNLITDISENVKILDLLEEELVGIHGIRRYNRDEYQNLNSAVYVNHNGCITDQLKKEQSNTAQWFMISDISRGYGVQLEKLLNFVEKQQRHPNEEESQLMRILYHKEVEFINRAYARITSLGVKANGKKCPSYEVPEAYMAVSTLFPQNPDDVENILKKITYIPGTNTPLAWAKSSLYEASKQLVSNLEKLERSDKKGLINFEQLKQLKRKEIKNSNDINKYLSALLYS